MDAIRGREQDHRLVQDGKRLYVDAHVHIYDCFNLSSLLSAAYENCRAASFQSGNEGNVVGVLLLTESSHDNWFQRLYSAAHGEKRIDSVDKDRWYFEPTEETCSVIARGEEDEVLFVVAGSQIVTKEKLEVLAIGTDQPFADGDSMTDVLDTVRAVGALPVIPWGFGKWTGRRGMIVKSLLDRAHSGQFFLGDNSGRPGFLPAPVHFKVAETKGIWVLPGSDPLPFASEYWRAGSFGFMLKGGISDSTPAAKLKQILKDIRTMPIPYGRRERPFRFLKNQLRMQLRKHK